MSYVNGISGSQLLQYIEKVERLEEEKQAIMSDMKEIFAEMNSQGFDIKIVKKVLKIRKSDKDKLEEENMLLETYLSSIGS